ncbi:MAG: hypothetical protein NTV93_15050 [Verrucomicrobia bacterium]|nr:hypothetical protein [Verrucomicrobiota bacterium]
MTPKGGVTPHTKFRIAAKKAEVLFTDYTADGFDLGELRAQHEVLREDRTPLECSHSSKWISGLTQYHSTT